VGGSQNPHKRHYSETGAGCQCAIGFAAITTVGFPYAYFRRSAILVGSLTGSVTTLSNLTTSQWIAGTYLGVGGGALAFMLWVMALERASPTRVASTMTVNPLTAGLLATQLVGEPITPNLVLGLVTVFAGIWIATTEAKKPQAPK
jgi:drug/metabolite transporter (DMT)-like permease